MLPRNNNYNMVEGELMCRNVINTTFAYGPKT